MLLLSLVQSATANSSSNTDEKKKEQDEKSIDDFFNQADYNNLTQYSKDNFIILPKNED